MALLLIASLLFALPAEIATPARAGASAPFLFAARGALLMSWLEPVPNGDRVALRFARFSGGAWSAPRTIVERNDLVVNWADNPSIAVDANGVLFAHWLQTSGGGDYACDVWMAVSRDGGATWSAPLLLNRDGKKNEHGFVSLAPLPEGGVAAAWLDGRNMVAGKEEGEMSLRYASVDARGVVRAEAALDLRTCECCATGLAVAADGPVVVYRDRSAENVRDVAVVRKAARGWTAPRLVHGDGWKLNGCPVNGPQAGAIGNRVAVAWFTGAQERPRVLVAFSDDGGATFGEPLRVDGGKPAGRVGVVMIDRETALVTWLEQTELRARRVDRHGKPSPSEIIAARAAGVPRIARVGNDVYFAWTEQSGAGKRIRIARRPL